MLFLSFESDSADTKAVAANETSGPKVIKTF